MVLEGCSTFPRKGAGALASCYIVVVQRNNWAYLLSGTGRDGTIPENATLLLYGTGRKK